MMVRAIRCEVWSRVVGYYRPVDSWNQGKQEEFKDREYHDLTAAMADAATAERRRELTDREGWAGE